jgi:hypothetical protein
MKKKIQKRLDEVDDEMQSIEKTFPLTYFIRYDWKLLLAKKQLLTEIIAEFV